MRHLTEEQLVGLVLNGQARCQTRDRGCVDGSGEHLAVCLECRAKYERLQDLAAYLRKARSSPPFSAWSRLKERLERSRRPGRDWTEPRWLPLVFAHLAVVVSALVLVMVLGGWLESSSLWEQIGGLAFFRTIGPRGLVGLGFAVGGGLGVLALMPILWWESRGHGQ